MDAVRAGTLLNRNIEGTHMVRHGFRQSILFAVTVIGLATTANAGSMYIFTVIDPPTTAGYLIAPANGMTVSSTKSGAGTFQLYAVDNVTGSFGIKSYQVKLNGTITTFLNRAPNGSWNDTDAAGPYAEGFNDVRTAVAATGITSAGQNPTNPFFIKGLGISAGNFASVNAGAPNFASGSTTASASGQWGSYANVFPSAVVRKPLLLAEGNYTGAAPTVDLITPGGTAVNYFTSASGSAAASAPQISGISPFGFPPVQVVDATIDNVNANNPGSLTHTFQYVQDVSSGPLTWSDFAFDSYTPDTGASDTAPAIPATFDPSTGKFSWTTVGSPRGVYTWRVTATIPALPGYSDVSSDVGFLHVHITQVPEPAALTHVGLAIACVGVLLGRRRANPPRTV
jgi:hypothetical protein